MLQGQFLYRAYQGELVKEEETVVLDSFAVQWFAVISSGRAGGQIRAAYYMEQGTRTTAWAIWLKATCPRGRTLSLIELEEDSVLRSSCVPAIL